MPADLLPPDESNRFEALFALELWDTDPEERFDRLTRLATRVLGVGTACINLVGHDRVFSKSHEGAAMNTPRNASFCAYTILGSEALVVPDAMVDPRFRDHPQVKDKPQLRFYVGVPLCAPDGSRVGTFCISDRVPRMPSEEDLRAVADFATMAQAELNVVELNPDYRADAAEQDELRLREERFRDIADAPGTFIWEMTAEGKTVYLSKRVTEVLGFSAEELVARGFFEGIWAADSAMAIAKFFYAARKNQRFSDLEFRYVTKDERTIWLSVRGAPRHDGQGKIIGYRGLAEEMTDRQFKHAQLLAERETAEKSARTQAEFLGRVSEDIRGPVNSLMGFTGQLLGNKLNLEQRRQAEKIRESAEQLLAIATDLNDFAKIQSGLLQFENHPFDLQVLVENVVSGIAPRAAEKGLEVHWHIAPDLPPGFAGDEARLGQILTNLLENAVENTISGDVGLSVERAESEVGDHFVLFSVWDTGAGYSPEELEGLFEIPAGQVADDRGLSITRSLAELMGGRIWAESEKNEGSGLHVAVPLQEALPPDPFAPDPILRGRIVLLAVKYPAVRLMLEAFFRRWGIEPIVANSPEEILQQVRTIPLFHLLFIDEAFVTASDPDLLQEIRRHRSAAQAPAVLLSLSKRPGEPAKSLPEGFFASALARPVLYRPANRLFATLLNGEINSAAPAPLFDTAFARRRPMRLLLAEDHLPTQKALASLLTQLGYRPDSVQNGREVLEALERHPYDVIFMDLAMPEMDGLEATRRIRERFKGPKRPWIIGMAVAGAESEREEARNASFDGQLIKPVRIDMLEPELIQASEHVGQVINLTVLSRYVEMTESTPESMREVADIFAEQTQKTLELLRAAIEGRRPQDISSDATQLYRSCANFGAERMQQLCESLQGAGKDGDFALATEFLDRLEIEFKRARAALDQFVTSPDFGVSI